MDDNNDLFGSIPSSTPEKRPQTLSHYTSLDGFLNIIKESQLRASNILYLNDRQEMIYGVKIAKEVLDEIIKNKSKRGNIMADYRAPSTTETPDTYACCLCEEPDMLSQWRGYGSATQSVSIQFSFPDLVNLVSHNGVEMRKVIYGRKQVMDSIRERLSNLDEETPFNALVARVLDLNMDEARRDAIYDLSPQFKNQSFEEEREWRIIVRAKSSKRVEFRVRDNVIMPYVNISADRLPISRITIGPGKEAELTRKSVENFLRNTAQYRDVKVVISQIPFRT